MTFFRILNSWSRLKNSAPRFALAVGLLLSGVIMGCGGGGGGSSPSAPDSGSSSGSGSVTPASLISLGVYTTTIANTSGNKAITLIINSNSRNSTDGRFYGWQFNSPEAQGEQPDIFSGTITGLGSSTASVSALKKFATYPDTLKAGSATFTSPTQGKLNVDVTESGNTIQWSDAVGITLDTTNSLVGTWTGNLYYPGAVAPFTISITINSDLSFTDLQFDGADCSTRNGIATLSPSGIDMYNLSMEIINGTGCVLRDDIAKPSSLSGVAYVSTSPVQGKTKRLQWVATTSDGRGLSFRADK
jgi:hypothetical protein